MRFFRALLLSCFFIRDVTGQLDTPPKMVSTAHPLDVLLVNKFPLFFADLLEFNFSKHSTYTNLINDHLGWPLYAGDNKDTFRSKRIAVESVFAHMRALDATRSFFYASDEVCEFPGVNSGVPVATGYRNLVSFVHELNVPYDVPCFVCSEPIVDSGAPRFFYAVTDRNPFAPFPSLMSIPQLVKTQSRRGTENIAPLGWPYVFTVSRALDSTSGSGVLRWTSEISFMGAITDTPSYGNASYPSMLSTNAGTFVCGHEQGHSLHLSDVAVNVDTLIHLTAFGPANDSELGAFVHSRRWTLGDYRETSNMTENMPGNWTDDKLNIRLDVSWEPWSCCSACCCSKESCGYSVSAEDCKVLESVKSRRGYLSFFKIDPFQPLNFTKKVIALANKTEIRVTPSEVKKGVALLDFYLSSMPHVKTGIPVASSLFRRDHVFDVIERYLDSVFGHRIKKFEAANPFGNLGMVVDAMSCNDETQKYDCSLLASCRASSTRLTAGAGKTTRLAAEMTPANVEKDPEVAKPDGLTVQEDTSSKIDVAHEICGFQATKTVKLKERETSYMVSEDLTYVFLIDEDSFGEVVRTNWSVGLRDVSLYDSTKPCGGQRIFVSGRKLYLRRIRRDDTFQGYFATAIVKATGNEIVLKVLLNFKSKTQSSKYFARFVKWISIALVALLSLITGVVVCHIMQRRSLNQKLRDIQVLESVKSKKTLQLSLSTRESSEEEDDEEDEEEKNKSQ